ncbi:hypothetical protein [Devosia sp. Root635]|uniref:hypothetical protein n=1 Tax=Devosia sp. Root635 TaxID=1736575 RepID=UPI0006F6A792|nr:hypothetical protein [Devosia sp. Root635]KRA44706.1 hypothetical protein ASD80_06070 [Devosia sp. Root635]
MRLEVLVTPAMVKAEARRRIEEAFPLWRQANILREGGPAVAGMGEFIDAIRTRSDEIETLHPIPADYSAEHYWTLP